MNKMEDLIGRKFNQLTVVEFSHTNKYRVSHWKCICDCGNKIVKIVQSGSLKTGGTQSCGCSRKLDTGIATLNTLFRNCKKSALERNYIFQLSLEEFKNIINQNCHYCSESPQNRSFSTKNNDSYIANGIDRKDNHIGYILENCLPCCIICNRAKGSLPYQSFLNYLSRFK